ncbi:NAD-dependent DNA ligase LigA, partial [bacterium]|nr:NAD-dependent DNA ligase LigA [bacterium]
KPKVLLMQENQPFAGQSVVITGTLSEPRNKWKARLERLGFQVTSSVSKKTDYVMAGENAGSKLSNAEKFNIKVLNEEQMNKLIQRESL